MGDIFGGNNSNVVTTTQGSTPPAWLTQFYQDNANERRGIYDIAKQLYNQNVNNQPYTEPRIQSFTTDQLRAMQMVRDNIGIADPVLDSSLARANAASQSYYDRGGQPYTPNAIQTGNFTDRYARSNIGPTLGQANLVNGNQFNQIRGGAYNPLAVNAERVGIDPNERLSSQDWDTQAAQQYMSPYTSTALQSTLAEMNRQSQLGHLGDRAKAAQTGAFGGSRQAIVEAERNRNLERAQSDVIAQAYDRAYNQGAQQFNTDQSRSMQAGSFNLGQDMQSALANQQAGMQAGLANQGQYSAAQQFGLGQGMQAQLANLDTQTKNAYTNQAAQNQFGLANQQYANAMAQYNDQANQAAYNTNAANWFNNQNLGMAGQVQNQNMGLQSFNANRDQFNTDQTRMMQSGVLALQQAPVVQSMAAQNANNLMNIGNSWQNFGQQNLNLGYNDYLQQRQAPYNNFAFLNSASQGQFFQPNAGTTTTGSTTSPGPNTAAQITGLASTGIGLLDKTGAFGGGGWLSGMFGGGGAVPLGLNTGSGSFMGW